MLRHAFVSTGSRFVYATTGQQSLEEKTLALDTEITTWNTYHNGQSFGNPIYLSTAYRG